MKNLKHSLAAAASGLALLFATGAQAQQQTTPTLVEDTRVAVEEVELSGPALWKVSDEDTTIYLFGTVHVLPKDKVWLSPTIDSALDSSDSLVTEIVMTPDMTSTMQALVMQIGTLPEGETLRGKLDEQELAAYDAAMTKLGLPVAAFDRYEPWMATLNLSMLPLLQQGYSPEAGVEKVLEGEADTALSREGLETIEYQLGIFDNLPEDAQIDYLIETAGMIDEIKPMLDLMVEEWLEGDADALAALMNEGMAETPILAEKLLYERNANWSEWIDARRDEPGTIFIAVGAGHLAGTKSVQDLLEQRDIQVVRVQ